MLRIIEINGIIDRRLRMVKSMKKKLVCVVTFSSLLVACEVQEPPQEPSVVYDNKVTLTDFSYVEDLPLAKKEAYRDFLIDGNIIHLKSFSPEEMLLIMLDVVIETRMDALYAITYSNNDYPTIELFEQHYMNSLEGTLLETYFMYRFYDRIGMNEASTPDLKIVQIEIAGGSRRYSKTFALHMQEEIWKIHLP